MITIPTVTVLTVAAWAGLGGWEEDVVLLLLKPGFFPLFCVLSLVEVIHLLIKLYAYLYQHKFIQQS